MATESPPHDEPAVLLLHGQPGSGHFWAPVIAALGQGVRVFAPDRPGWGRNPEPAAGVAANARAAAELLEREGIERAVVAGHSWGGAVAVRLAARDPERVAGLVLVAPAVGQDALGPVDRALDVPVLGGALALAGVGVGGGLVEAASASRRVRRLLPPGARRVVALSAGRSRTRRAWRSYLLESRALLAEMRQLERDVEAVHAPAVVLSGDRDRIVPLRASRRVAERLPAGELIIVPGRGHLLPLEQPHDVAGAIAEIARGAARSPRLGGGG